MLSRSSVFVVVFCAAVSVATCAAQSYTTYGVVSTSQPQGWNPRNIYAVDLNNDGIPDLIEDEYWISGQEQQVFGVSIANGDGTFKSPVQYSNPPGIFQSPMAFGDFNGDGKVDIAMIAGAQTIAIYLGNGDGTFVNPWYSNVSIKSTQYLGSLSSIVAADFNHDGKLDLAVIGVDNSSNTVYILPGEGNGLFSSADPILTVPGLDNASGWGVQRMLGGDFDGDTNADLAVIATTGQPDGGVETLTTHVLYGDGNFGFQDTTPITTGAPTGMNSGDLNSDGKTDLFAFDANSDQLDTYYGQGDRTFVSYTQSLPAASYPYGLDYTQRIPEMADFNDDGRNDLVTSVIASSGSFLVFFLATPTPGQFDLQTWNVNDVADHYPVVGDFNHDGKPDWAYVAFDNGGPSTVYTGLNGTAGQLWSDCDYPSVGRGINLCSPAISSGSTVNFNATAHSYNDLRKIELWVDGTKLGEQYNTWEGNGYFNFSSTFSPGTHSGTYFAADYDNTLLQYNFNFTVPSSCGAPTSPGVQICAPATGSSISSQSVLVQATANITGTLARMEIWVDSTKKYTETNSTSLSPAVMATPGTHQFTVYAVNTDGTVWSQAVTATIQ